MSDPGTESQSSSRPEPAELREVRNRLVELGLDLHRIWRHTPDELWGRLDAELWDLTHNRWVVLQTVSQSRLDELCGDESFRRRLDEVWDQYCASRERPRWFDLEHGATDLTVAYFSMEYMVSESLPIYSGGLGNVAGDQLKAASDLGVPVVGVGILYQQGYFRQLIDPDGNQRAVYPYNDPSQLPLQPVRDADGEWVAVTVPFAGAPVRARAWQAQVGSAVLYLLDTNIPSNRPDVRGITSELYGGDAEVRLAQEILLGIGGWRLLRALGIEPDVCHLNEGHAAFAALERARDLSARLGCSFDEAMATTRAGNLFTTHTPVAAGFDRFPAELVERYLGRYLADEVGIDPQRALDLGEEHPGDETFNMAYLAMRSAGAVNGVSRLHGQVSRELFSPLFPRRPIAEVPIDAVTNGIHVATWDDSHAHGIWERIGAGDLFTSGRGDPADGLLGVPDEDLWRMRSLARDGLVRFVRTRVARQLAYTGVAEDEAAVRCTDLFDPNALTIGFARRFAAYKRPNLMLTDPDRLAALLSDPTRPVQLLVAGKAHPADLEGQAMLRRWVEFSRRPDVEGKVEFIADYDMLVTRQLVQGVDLWINTPRRPWEASGTSGMKILANGGLNLSTIDGWWAEAYQPDRGWAIGSDDTAETGTATERTDGTDDEEALQLYEALEREIVPMFFERDTRGVPSRWVAAMRQSMRYLTTQFSADRTVREYTERHYLPMTVRYRQRVADSAALGRSIAAWHERVRRSIHRIHHTGPMIVDTGSDATAGSAQTNDAASTRVALFVYLDGVHHDEIGVELYADPIGDETEPTVVPMEPAEALVGADNAFRYEAEVPSGRDVIEFTARFVPRNDAVAIPLEEPAIAWVDRRTDQ